MTTRTPLALLMSVLLVACTSQRWRTDDERATLRLEVPASIRSALASVPTVVMLATFYVWRDTCPAPGDEKPLPGFTEPAASSARIEDAWVDVKDVAPGQTGVGFEVRIPLTYAAAPGANFCARVVYTGRLSLDADEEAGALGRRSTRGETIRLAHQETIETFKARPYSDTAVVLGPLVGADAFAERPLYDADSDTIPNLRELQLALRPLDADPLEWQQSGVQPVPLDAITLRLGVADGGFSTEEPEVDVQVAAMRIDAVEVANWQYRVCMGLVAGEGDGRHYACSLPVAQEGLDSPPVLDVNQEVKPVVGITHEQAESLCTTRGMRLPTEAEWERAARVPDANTSRRDDYPWGGPAPVLDGGNSCRQGRFLLYSEGNVPVPCAGEREMNVGPIVDENLQPIREKQNNGLYDLAGNAAEWTKDSWNSALHEHLQSSGSGSYVTSGSVFSVRGGSFRSGPRFVRTYARAGVNDSRDAGYEAGLMAVGVRCVGSR